jgi:hypothetical protein
MVRPVPIIPLARVRLPWCPRWMHRWLSPQAGCSQIRVLLETLRQHGRTRRGSAASAVMLAAAAVTAGVTSATVRVPPAETFSAAVEARPMPAASHVEAARTPTANGLGSVPATKQMEATRVRWFSG